uniref:Mitochondrial import inner membrane translocase subunit TIM50 n=1 Tax=Lygus hesperus TaxID=30085 RepID=A0A0A9W6F1_LYGHE
MGSYIKDLSLLGRDIDKVVIIDNSPSSYYLQPDNALPIQSWFFRQDDRQLGDLVPLLDDLAECENIPDSIKRYRMHFTEGYYKPPQNRIPPSLTIQASTPTTS